MQNFHILPLLRDSLTYVYIERARIQRYRQSVEVVDQTGRAALPIATLSVLLLGPGTDITHEAVKLICQNGCLISWVGEDGMKFYAQGMGETRKAWRLLHQAHLVSDAAQHAAVVRRMYTFRFDEELDDSLSIEQIRGREGVRVRNTYKICSRRYGVKWHGRNYKRDQWNDTDPINRALSAANALLNGLCHTTIISGGYSPGLGFVHTGKSLSFVYDVADLYKTQFTIPAAFQTVALGEENVESRVRQRLRAMFREAKLLERILPDIDSLLATGADPEVASESDAAAPAPLWDDESEMDEGENE